MWYSGGRTAGFAHNATECGNVSVLLHVIAVTTVSVSAACVSCVCQMLVSAACVHIKQRSNCSNFKKNFVDPAGYNIKHKMNVLVYNSLNLHDFIVTVCHVVRCIRRPVLFDCRSGG